MLFFARRRHAIAIVGKFESNIRSPLAAELIEMIIWGAKNLKYRNLIGKIDSVIISADGICYNSTAARRLARELNLNEDQIREIREKLQHAIVEFACQNDRRVVLKTLDSERRSLA